MKNISLFPINIFLMILIDDLNIKNKNNDTKLINITIINNVNQYKRGRNKNLLSFIFKILFYIIYINNFRIIKSIIYFNRINNKIIIFIFIN